MFSIYKITNLHNNKVYIGYTTRNAKVRFEEHLKKASNAPNTHKISNAIRKYGKNSFVCETIYQSFDLSHIKSMEDYFIDEYDSFKNGYNSSRGGQGGCIVLFKENPHYDDICKRISHSQKRNKKYLSEKAKKQHEEGKFGRPYQNMNEETRKRLSAVRKGKKNSQEHIEKQKESLRKKFNDPKYVHPNTGRIRSEKERNSISENHADVNGDKNPMFGKSHTEHAKKIQQEKAANRKKKECIHCKKIVDVSNYSRWHGDNCKKIGSNF
jgi:group I intron endonuclease